MTSESRIVKLGDVLKIEHGWPFKSEHFKSEGDGLPTVVSIGNFRYSGGFRFDETQRKLYGGEYPVHYQLRPDDILLVMTCQTAGGEILGIPARVPNDGQTYLHNQRMGRVTHVNPGLDPKYLYYLFLSKDFNQHLFGTASGTKILHTSPTRIESYTFSLPDLEEQQAIGNLLYALDVRIDLAGSASKTLEQVARTVFKSWFVDFDPVRAKAEGREPEGMDAATAALFPSSFVDGGVPEGWIYLLADDLMNQSRETVNPLKYPNQSFDHYSLPAFDEGKRPKLEMGSDIKSNKTIVTEGSLLVSKLNPHIPRIWLPDIRSGSISISSTEFLCFIPKHPFSSEYLFCQFSEEGFATSMMGLTTGTSNSHQRINVEALMAQKLMRPPDPIVEVFTSLARPILNRVKANIAQQQTLAELRDTLLPRLISGKLRVPEAEKVVEAAL